MSRVEWFQQELKRQNAEMDDDPLDLHCMFCNYLSGMDSQRVLPNGQLAQDLLAQQLEFSTRMFKQDGRYKQDVRYLKLWLQFAPLVERPREVYDYLHARGIGTDLSLLYESHCKLLVEMNKHERAVEVLHSGIKL